MPPRATAATGSLTMTLDAQETIATVRRVADWALEHPEPIHPRDWAMAPLYDGLIDASTVTGDPRYLAAVIRAGQCVSFVPGPRTHHADDHAAGRSWLRLYQMMEPKDPALLEPWEDLFAEIVIRPLDDDLRFGQSPPPDRSVNDRWTWADALYMAPPTIVTLTGVTGDERYLRFMDAEFRFAYDALFDEEENLWYRDARYIGDRTPNGEKVFWSRGNAWVYAGLALVLEALPENWPARPFYVELLQQMSRALAAAQQPDGFWYPSLQDPEHPSMQETSGTALFVLGMASAVRQGLLDPAESWPIIERGWGAILTAIDPDGAVNLVQPPASQPEVFDPGTRVAYGTGAVLGAGSAIVRALSSGAQVQPATLLSEASELVSSVPDLWDGGADVCGSP